MSLCRIPSSSSEDGTAAPLTESDLSDSISADSHSLSAGEEEPPTKRKRDKALKTAAERNRKSGRMKATVVALSPKSSAMHKVKQEEIALAADVANTSDDESANKAPARNCIPDCEDDSVVNNGTETEKVEQHLDKQPSAEGVLARNEDCQVDAVVLVSEDSRNCITEQTTTTTESASSGERDNVGEVDGAEVAGKTEYSAEECAAVSDRSCLADESHKKECTGVEQNSCSAEDTEIAKSVHDNTNSESTGQTAENTVFNGISSEDKGDNDEQSVDTESHQKKNDRYENHDGTHCNDVPEVSGQSATCEDESKSNVKSEDKSVSNGHPVCIAKKTRGRPRKSNKKGRKKRVHSNVANTASVTEVPETDYEPTKKLGRPSKKSKLAQLVAEACDSLPQSEDDVPLIALRRAAEDDLPLIELRRSARSNKGQRKLDQLVLEQPKKRNRAKHEEKERKRAEKEEKRRKREAELQEQAALKAKKVSSI